MMHELFAIASGMDALPASDPFGEAIGDCSRGLSACTGGRKRIAHLAERERYLAPSQADGLREIQRRLREEAAFVGVILKQHDPHGLKCPIDTALILSSCAPASVRQAAK